MAIKHNIEFTQYLGDGGTTNPTVPPSNTTPVSQGMLDKTSYTLTPNNDRGIVRVDDAGNTETVIPDLTLENNIAAIKAAKLAELKNKGNGDSGSSTGGDSGSGTGGGTGDGNNNSGNAYYDVINANSQKPEYKPTGKDGINGDASAGAGAAKDTQYSWDKKGTDQAQNQYQQDALKAKQDALANRQTIEQNALQYQQQADMMQYANNQNAEKVGWTGGYVLDQNRQMEYLKASIQAQMYGAMELQKYGYDSALAAARLSYDLNQQQFAHQYYQDAVNVAISEAQITGTYFSAETRDMMSQYNAAEQELGSLAGMSEEQIEARRRAGQLTPEQERAFEVRKNIDSWYDANNVSTTGIKTLAAWEAEQSMAQQWADSQWEKYQAALASAENKEAENADVYIKLDKDGNPMYDGASVETLNFRTMDAEAIIEYANTTGDAGKEQVYGYVDNMFEETILNQVKTSETYTNEKGESIPIINEEKLKEAITNNTDAKEIATALGEYSYSTEAGDTKVDITLDKDGNIKVETHTSKAQQDKQEEQQTVNAYKQTISDYKAGKTNTLSFTAMTQGNDALNTYGMKVQEGKIGDSKDIDDDFDIDIGGKNYDLDVDWKGRSGFWGVGKGMLEEEFNDAVKYLETQYQGQSKNELVIYNGRVWFYSEKMGKWGLVQTNVGGNNLLEDLQEAANGTEPQRWK